MTSIFFRLRHPNIVQLYDTYDERLFVYLVMELVSFLLQSAGRPLARQPIGRR